LEPLHIFSVPLPATLSFVKFNAAFKGTGGRRKRKLSGEGERRGEKKQASFLAFVKE
jgi:hypothetical protein